MRVLPRRSPVRLRIRRDCVAMGDEGADRELHLPHGARVRDLVEWVDAHRFLPSVANGSTWALRLDRTIVAVVPRGHSAAGYVTDPDERLPSRGEVMLRYLLRADVADTVAALRQDPHREDLRDLRGPGRSPS